jgi:hypothetical protein
MSRLQQLAAFAQTVAPRLTAVARVAESPLGGSQGY